MAEKIIKLNVSAERIICFSSSISALANLTRKSDATLDVFPTMIFLDIQMPGMDGFEFPERFSPFSEGVKKHCAWERNFLAKKK